MGRIVSPVPENQEFLGAAQNADVTFPFNAGLDKTHSGRGGIRRWQTGSPVGEPYFQRKETEVMVVLWWGGG